MFMPPFTLGGERGNVVRWNTFYGNEGAVRPNTAMYRQRKRKIEKKEALKPCGPRALIGG
jgi:hypothetical protein